MIVLFFYMCIFCLGLVVIDQYARIVDWLLDHFDDWLDRHSCDMPYDAPDGFLDEQEQRRRGLR